MINLALEQNDCKISAPDRLDNAKENRFPITPAVELQRSKAILTMSAGGEIPYGPGPLKGLMVLVAEDDAWAAERIGVMLEEEGARLIGPCRSVAEARELLASYAVQFVLIDLNLADNFADALVSDVVKRGIPFVLITGYAAFPSNAYDGAVAVLRKPFPRRRLVELLSQFA